MKKYIDIKQQLLSDPEVEAEYHALKSEFEAIEKIIALRIKHNMTQEELAEKIGTKQSAISRLERGMINPSISFLSRLAAVFNKELVVEFR